MWSKKHAWANRQALLDVITTITKCCHLMLVYYGSRFLIPSSDILNSTWFLPEFWWRTFIQLVWCLTCKKNLLKAVFMEILKIHMKGHHECNSISSRSRMLNTSITWQMLKGKIFLLLHLHPTSYKSEPKILCIVYNDKYINMFM